MKRWEKWGITLTKRKVRWPQKSSGEESGWGCLFPGLAPITVHGLIPKGSTVKISTEMDGLASASRDQRPHCRGFLLKTWPRLERWACIFTDWAGLPTVWDWGFFWFYLLHLLVSWPRFVYSSGHCPSHQVSELSVLSCLMGISLGLGWDVLFPFLLFSSPSSPGVLEQQQGMKNDRIACGVFFLFLGGLHHAATVHLCSCKAFPPCLTSSHVQPAPKQEEGALCSPLLDSKHELQMWENLFWIPPGCKAIVVLF